MIIDCWNARFERVRSMFDRPEVPTFVVNGDAKGERYKFKLRISSFLEVGRGSFCFTGFAESDTEKVSVLGLHSLNGGDKIFIEDQKAQLFHLN